MACASNETVRLARSPRGGGVDWTLPAEEVHVWCACLDRAAEAVLAMRALLSRDELARADAYRFERHRSRFVVGRALLRGLLARYVGAVASGLEFSYGEFDKPALAGGPWFNLSHSGSVALFAFSCAGEVGVDVELYDESFASERVAERFFSPAEVASLRSLAPRDRPRGFLTCWTRKEAFIKARGDGLSLPLDSFDVTLAPDRPAAVLRTAWSAREATQWQLRDLSDPDTGYVAALAIRAYESTVLKRYSIDTMDTIEGGMPGLELL